MTTATASYEIHNIKALNAESHVDEKTGKRSIRSVELDGRRVETSDRFWNSLFSKYGFGKNVFNYFDPAEVVERISDRREDDRVRFCLFENPGAAMPTLLAVSNPAKPVPYMGEIVTGMDAEYMIADQRFAARRPDVLVYQTEVLTEDVTLVGPIEVDLTVSTSGTDSDWVVKLIDVYPDDFPEPKNNPKQVRMGGYQQLVRGDVMRGKFRTSFEKPKPFDPNKPTAICSSSLYTP